ncbi:hypothetical protein EJ03DRAFT_90702 [Teratosphaeria nubilosa]|uniref:Uncharacterized protein n=1 Tax=Teratosphaeria nubilosa TaxID=161662 RepID=A0A6G1LAM8_9PEZI|nr:hypothetical protein EJ03DRAFT_90702 [Teratosphaeria nubilosa]
MVVQPTRALSQDTRWAVLSQVAKRPEASRRPLSPLVFVTAIKSQETDEGTCHSLSRRKGASPARLKSYTASDIAVEAQKPPIAGQDVVRAPYLQKTCPCALPLQVPSCKDLEQNPHHVSATMISPTNLGAFFGAYEFVCAEKNRQRLMRLGES